MEIEKHLFCSAHLYVKHIHIPKNAQKMAKSTALTMLLYDAFKAFIFK